MSLKLFVQEKLNRILDNEKNLDLDIPRYEHGDFALNIAFKLAKAQQKAPNIIAQELSDELNNGTDDLSATAIGGFINIKISHAFLYEYFTTFLKKRPNTGNKKPILLEYVSANPTGPLHIGHGRWAVLGDALFRLLKSVGQTISNEFYVNDAGNQIQLFNQSIEAKKTNQNIPDDGYGGYFVDYVISNNMGLSNVDFVIEYQKSILKELGCEFDAWFKESLLHEDDILSIIKTEYPNHIYEKDGAMWFKTTDFGDDKDRVIQKENGDITYFSADIIYHLNKIKRGFSHLINIWGADHHGYIKRIESIIKAKDNNTKLTVILGQLVHLFKNGEPVKMSKRTGELIELKEVMDEIGIDATRYFLLNKKPDQTLAFDLSIASQQNMENPVYYIQYAHARICTIIKKTEALNVNSNLELNDMDRRLMLEGARYYDHLYEAANNLEPYKVTQYLHDLAKVFHSFYQKNQIICNNEIHMKRLNIVCTTRDIIQHCASILGISTPEKM
jgi:arginyl-tRNA synthetase